MDESVEQMQARHRRELRDLQGRITNKKKNATKKTRKGVNDECANMERELKAKHAAELAGLQGGEEDDDQEEENVDDSTDRLADALADTSIEPAPQAASNTPQQQTPPQQTPKKSRNRQKERLARRAAEQQALAAAAAAEASHMVDHAAVERATLRPLIAQAGRAEHAIRADGHCLFAAVADQLAQLGRSVEVDGKEESELPPFRTVRHVAAAYMQAHGDDFAPFLLAYSGDDDAPDLETHIAQIRDTAEWGGQMELVALANAYGVNIRVLHDGRSELIEPAGGAVAGGGGGGDGDGDDKDKDGRPTLWLVYYRHGFGLGEHYNSLRAKPA